MVAGRCAGFANPAQVIGFEFPRLPGVAEYCARVRANLGSRVRALRVAGSFANRMWLALEGPPNRRRELPTRDFITFVWSSSSHSTGWISMQG